METVQQFARRASKVLFGSDEPKSGEEPVSGQMGNVAAGEPYDAGNIGEPDKPSSSTAGQGGPTEPSTGMEGTSTRSTTTPTTTATITSHSTIGKAVMATAAAIGMTGPDSTSKSTSEGEGTTKPVTTQEQSTPIEQRHAIPRKASSPTTSAAAAGPSQMAPSALPIRGDTSKPRSNTLPIRTPSDQPVVPAEVSPTTRAPTTTMADTTASPRDATSSRIPGMTGPAGRTERMGMAETREMPGINDEMATTSTPLMTTRAPAAASISSPTMITTPPTTTSTSPPSTTTRSPMPATTTTTTSPMPARSPDTATTSSSPSMPKAPTTTPKTTPSMSTPTSHTSSTSPPTTTKAQPKSMLDNDAEDDDYVPNVKLTGPGPRPLEELAREHGGDAGDLIHDTPQHATTGATAAGGGADLSAGKNRRDSAKSLGGEAGTGDEYVKSSGLAADGGNFDAAKPGAGREADRLLETKGVHRSVQHPHETHDGGEVREGHEHREHREHHEARDMHDALAREKVKLKDKIKAALHKGTPSA